MSEVPERPGARRLRYQEAAEAGFTLVELVVVLLIIATLLAVAVPRSFSRPKTANLHAAPANLLYTSDNQSHIAACSHTTMSTLKEADTGLILSGSAGSASTVSINPSGAIRWQVPPVAPKGDCWMTVGQTATQPVATDSASRTKAATGGRHGVTKPTTTAHRRLGKNTPADADSAVAVLST